LSDFNVYEGIKAGLEEAIAYQKGDRTRCRVTVREIPVPEYRAADVVRTRRELNLSQRGLANVLGVSHRTVEAWETGRNVPSGAARNLLYLVDKDHSLVERLTVRQNP